MVTKKSIIQAIAQKQDLTQSKTKEIVQLAFDAIVEALGRGERIELRNFGVFDVRTRAARMGRNPMTGESVPIKEKCVVTFRPGKKMEEAMEKLSADGEGSSELPRR